VPSEPGAAKPQAPRVRGRRVAAGLLLAVAVLGVSPALYRVVRQRDEEKTPAGANGAGQEAPTWRPRPPLTAEEAAKLPSPLDALKGEAMELPPDAPPEAFAVLGKPSRFALPERTSSHWMAQSGDGRLLAIPCGRNILLYEASTGT